MKIFTFLLKILRKKWQYLAKEKRLWNKRNQFIVFSSVTPHSNSYDVRWDLETWTLEYFQFIPGLIYTLLIIFSMDPPTYSKYRNICTVRKWSNISYLYCFYLNLLLNLPLNLTDFWAIKWILVACKLYYSPSTMPCSCQKCF